MATEFIRDRQNAVVVNYKSEDGIYEGVKLILEDSHLRQSVIQNGRTSVTGFTVERMVRKLELVYLG